MKPPTAKPCHVVSAKGRILLQVSMAWVLSTLPLVPLEMKENTSSHQPSSHLKLSISSPLVQVVHHCHPLNRKIILPFIRKELPS